MRRRRRAAAVPEELARFVVSEWPGTPWEAFALWRAARDAYGTEHPDSLILGDALDMLRAEIRVREALVGRVGPDPAWRPYDPTGGNS